MQILVTRLVSLRHIFSVNNVSVDLNIYGCERIRLISVMVHFLYNTIVSALFAANEENKIYGDNCSPPLLFYKLKKIYVLICTKTTYNYCLCFVMFF